MPLPAKQNATPARSNMPCRGMRILVVCQWNKAAKEQLFLVIQNEQACYQRRVLVELKT